MFSAFAPLQQQVFAVVARPTNKIVYSLLFFGYRAILSVPFNCSRLAPLLSITYFLLLALLCPAADGRSNLCGMRKGLIDRVSICCFCSADGLCTNIIQHTSSVLCRTGRFQKQMSHELSTSFSASSVDCGWLCIVRRLGRTLPSWRRTTGRRCRDMKLQHPEDFLASTASRSTADQVVVGLDW